MLAAPWVGVCSKVNIESSLCITLVRSSLCACHAGWRGCCAYVERCELLAVLVEGLVVELHELLCSVLGHDRSCSQARRTYSRYPRSLQTEVVSHGWALSRWSLLVARMRDRTCHGAGFVGDVVSKRMGVLVQRRCAGSRGKAVEVFKAQLMKWRRQQQLGCLTSARGRDDPCRKSKCATSRDGRPTTICSEPALYHRRRTASRGPWIPLSHVPASSELLILATETSFLHQHQSRSSKTSPSDLDSNSNIDSTRHTPPRPRLQP